MNARSKAYEPSANSNYEKEMEKSFTVILCNLRALEEIHELEFYGSLVRWDKHWILSIQSWFVTNCAPKVSRKKYYSKQADMEQVTKVETRRMCLMAGYATGFFSEPREGMISEKAKPCLK